MKRPLISCLLAAGVTLFGSAAQAAGDFFEFVNPGDPYAKESLPTEPTWVPQAKDLLFWPDADRQGVSACLRRIKSRAPGLVARSCNGEPLHLTRVDARLIQASASSTPGLITCAHYLMALPDLNEMFVHELTHTIDCEAGLGSSQEFSRLIVPYLRRYRASGHEMGQPFHTDVTRLADTYHLPSGYAASNPSEALAEYTTAMVLGKWSPPAAIEKYVRENILSMPAGVDEKRALMRQVYILRSRGHYPQAIALATKTLRLDAQLSPAWLSMGGCWNGMHEYELALYCAQRGLQQLKENGCPGYDPNYAWGKDIARFARAALNEQAHKQKSFTTPAYIQLQPRSR